MTISTLFTGLSHRGGRTRSPSGMVRRYCASSVDAVAGQRGAQAVGSLRGGQRIDEQEPAAECAGAAVGLLAVTDHHRILCSDAESRQRALEDRGVGLDHADFERQHELVDVSGRADRRERRAGRRTRYWTPPRS